MFRSWTEADFKAIVEICNLHDKAVDPLFDGTSDDEVRDELNGFYDEVFAEVFEVEGKITDLVTAQLDKKRKRAEIDVFGHPDNHHYDQSLSHAISWVKNNYPGFEIRGSCNQNDAELIAANERAGLMVVRKYWTMVNRKPQSHYPALPTGVAIRKADFETERTTWHSLLMASFRDHYGYAQKSFADWDEQQRKMSLQDEDGVFFLEVEGEPVGLLVCTNHRAELNGGFIDKLGVLSSHRGKGYGELLLRWGCAYSAQKGFTQVSLGVDSTNQTGAVDLYLKAGFEPQNVWLAFSDSETL